ncbi:pectate lyase [Salegentibacter sp. F188]|uniref:Pectate lyase n=1 Tax=Autumnicola patrickiae TaxID=3075591 RepID=A0ABU3DYU9_9FLAO|nr:pectate lyase [Salegentibacter sp. F188]MDT0688908.1 pectate lyase [Salegentibacter sp. F188]
MKSLFSGIILLLVINLSAQETPTIYLIGDSTMSDKKDPEQNPEHGWGQMLPELLTDGIKVENHAVNGRSSRSFISEGRWEKVREQLKEGDYVFIQFGHNDQKIKDATRYTNPFTQYRYNLERFVKETRERGATPLLFSSIVRRNFNEHGVLVDTHGEYPLVVRMVARNLEVPFVDLQWLTEKMEIAYGPEKSKDLHLHLEPGENDYKPEGLEDDTHLSKKGATLVATLALQEIARQNLELFGYIKKETLQNPGFGMNNNNVQSAKKMTWREAQRQEDSWYGSREAQRIADNVMLYQNNNGGWNKNINMADELTPAEKRQLQKEKAEETGTTIDNGATVKQMRYLAKVYDATGEEAYKQSFLQGIDFLLEAQYENGGWPQFYPIREGYYEHITFNDGAMIGVMNLLRDVALEEEPFIFVDAERQEDAQKAIEKGLEIILKTQIKVDGKLTAWAAQHDKNSLEPAKARSYELPSLSGKESVDIVEYLMKIEEPNEQVKNAIRSAVKWFEDSKVTGKKLVRKNDSSLPRGYDRVLVEDPDADLLWARFYEIGTNKPMFVGRDGIVKYNLSEIEHERRIGYSYIGNYAEDLLKEDFPEWEEKN